MASTKAEVQNELGSVNLEDYADVVYSYNCKFCDFQSTKMQDITTHVISEHVTPKRKEPVPNETQTTSVQQVVTAEAILRETQTVGSELITNTVDEQTQSELIQDGNGTISESIFAINRSDDDNSQSEKPSTEHNEVIIEPENLIERGEGILSESWTGEENKEDTQDIYVCGQCGLGFSTIQQCKSHMVEEHKLNLTEKTTESDGSVTVEYVASNKVSVATQAELTRKPGRKRKADMVAECEKEDKSDEQDLEETDLSLLTPRMSEQQGKRKVRPPKNLVEDYYIGKPKHNVTRRAHKRFACEHIHCHLKFRSQDALDVHEKTHLPLEDEKPAGAKTMKPRFQCIKCDQIFDLWKPLQLHLWNLHQIDTDLFKCKFCSFRSDTWQKVDLHAENHTDDDLHSCSLCSETFRTTRMLNKHMLTHRGSDESGTPGEDKMLSSTSCTTCGRNFANKKSLKKHTEIVHEKIKPFVCSYCGYTTGRKAMLLLHVRTHTGEKPFKCDMCTYQTCDHNTLRRHRMRHTGQRPYKCQFCPYECIQSISLKTHLKNKHPGVTDNLYCCNQCQYHTVNRNFYERHLEDHKRGLVEDVTTGTKGSTSVSNIVIPVPDNDEMKQLKIVPSGTLLSSQNIKVGIKVAPSNMISLAAKEADVIDGQTDESTTQLPLMVFDGQAAQAGNLEEGARYVTTEENVEGVVMETVEQGDGQLVSMLSQDPVTKEFFITIQPPEESEAQSPVVEGEYEFDNTVYVNYVADPSCTEQP